VHATLEPRWKLVFRQEAKGIHACPERRDGFRIRR
jgi:hypothetical protein